jgi:hypothetical protein
VLQSHFAKFFATEQGLNANITHIKLPLRLVLGLGSKVHRWPFTVVLTPIAIGSVHGRRWIGIRRMKLRQGFKGGWIGNL